jgi:competence protein ComEA
MIKRLMAALMAMLAATAFAAVDVNKATAADLDGIKGIGPGISAKILDERKKGIGEGNAAKFSAEGMTVNGSAFKGVAAAPTAKKEDKPTAAAAPAAPAAKKEDKPMAAPAAATAAAKPAAADKKDAKAKAEDTAAAPKK